MSVRLGTAKTTDVDSAALRMIVNKQVLTQI
jgi:hypothetical protein